METGLGDTEGGRQPAALAVLANLLTCRPLPPGDEETITGTVAALQRPTASGSFPAILAGLRLVHPHFSLAARNAGRALLSFSEVHPAEDAAAAWLLLGQILASRRELLPAADAARQAHARFAALRDRAGSAYCRLLSGRVAMIAGRYDDARRALQASRSTFTRLEDGAGLAEATLELSHYHTELCHFPRALALAEEAELLSAGEPWLQCRCQIQAADCLFHRNHYREAAERYEALHEICSARGWRMDLAHVRVMQGLLLNQEQQSDGAERLLQEALGLYQAEEARYYVAVCQRGLAMVYRRRQHFEPALAAARAALEILEESGAEVAVGRIYHAIGLIYHSWNRYDEALAAYDEALRRYPGHLLQEQWAVQVNQAQIYEGRGSYHAALRCYEEAADTCRAHRMTNMMAQCLDSMALLNERLGRYADAADLYRKARRAFVRCGAVADAQMYALGQARMLHRLGQEARGRRLLGRTRAFFQARGLRAPLALADLAAGEMLARSGWPRRALACYGKAFAYLNSSGLLIDAAYCRLLMGEAQLALGDPQEAEAMFSASMELLGPHFPDLAGRAGHGWGKAAQEMGQPLVAAARLRQAVDYLSAARRGIVTEDDAGTFFRSRRQIYDDALHGCLAVGEVDAALQLLETSRAQVLASLLQQREVARAAFDDRAVPLRSLWEESRKIGRELDALRARFGFSEAPDTRSLSSLQESPRQARGDLEQIEVLARRQEELFQHIRRFSARFGILDPAQPFDIAHFRRTASAVFGRDWHALAYWLETDKLLVFHVTPTGVQHWEHVMTPLASARLRQAVDPDPQKRQAVFGGALRGFRQGAPADALLAALGDLLLPKPARQCLAPGRRLLIIPHGLLHYLPFHALLLEDGLPLVERAQVSYAPALLAWETLQERRASRSGRWGGALACGVADFGARAPELPEAEWEARRVASLFGGQSEVWLGEAATCERLAACSDAGRLADFDVVHLAVHARFDGKSPAQSRLLLSDGSLALPEVFRLRLGARLVTLSACETALSRLEPGDELLGLREALLFAGADALLVSLWPVNDRSTGQFMTRFYRKLLEQVRDGVADSVALASALAETQRDMIAAGEPAYRWAPFVLVG